MNRFRILGLIGAVSIAPLYVRGTADAQFPREAGNADEVSAVNPFDPEVPGQLTRMKRSVSLGRIHPPTQKVKAALRERLAAEPNAELAWALATIISNGLSATDLLFDAPSDGGSTKQDREDPDESYASLAKVLEMGLQTAPPKSDLWRRFGLSLAKVRLLQGDWPGMNAVLEQLGQSPIPESQRANLPAPPPDWNNLLGTWQPADESMRTGTCAIEFQFEKDGKGLAGAHVLVKHPRDPRLRAYSGIRADTLLLARRPLVDERSHVTFGYHARDRAMTRYAVSDATGKVRIEGLPKIPVVVEVLVPTGNFAERGHSWDLLMELAPGELRPTEWGEPDSIRGNKGGPTIAELKENDTVHYPKLIVRRQLEPNLADWTEGDADDFVLEWQSLADESAGIDRYEVEMMLTAPSQMPHMVTQQRVIQTNNETVRKTRWEVGANGVGGKHLRPGNIYMFEVRALDRQNKVVARLPRTRVWVPWTHRKSSPPVHDVSAIREVPIYDRVWWQGRTIQRGQRPIELREAVATYLSANADAFEYEYVLLGQAWLNCLDGFSDAERVVLEELAEDLPEGNVARGTARSLLNLLDDGKPLPKRLEFVADE